MIGHATKPQASNGCEWARPILISSKDALTDPTAKAILAYNEAGARICGWKPHKAGK